MIQNVNERNFESIFVPILLKRLLGLMKGENYETSKLIYG